MPPVSIGCMAAIGPACLIERAVPLKPGKIPSFTSGNPMRVEFIARRNPVMAGEDQLQAAADAHAVNGRDDRNGKLLDPLEQRIDRLQAVDDLLLGLELSNSRMSAPTM